MSSGIIRPVWGVALGFVQASNYTSGQAQQRRPRAAQGLALSTFQVVLVPTIVGVLTNEFFPGVVKKLKSVLPLVGVALTTLLCASPCAQVATILR